MRNRGSTNKFRCRSAVMILFAVAGSLLVSAWATPNPSKTDNELNGVSAISSTDAWAVGYYGVGAQGSGEANTLALHWNGTKWARIPSPDVGASANLLNGVAAASPGSARAVGDYAISGGMSTLVLRWDGTRWAQVPSPISGSRNAQLLGVAAGPASGFWAVGYFVATIPQVDTLALHCC